MLNVPAPSKVFCCCLQTPATNRLHRGDERNTRRTLVACFFNDPTTMYISVTEGREREGREQGGRKRGRKEESKEGWERVRKGVRRLGREEGRN